MATKCGDTSNISAKSDRFEKLWYLGYLQSRSTFDILNVYEFLNQKTYHKIWYLK